jgi:N-acetylglucosaminyl-diphospho-decaprenol L-rhamnosyltransferase
MDVSAVIVTYNALPWIERSLESLEGTGAEVIVVDHGSTDGTLDVVRERFPATRVIEQENRGLGGGSNTGMRAGSGRYHLLLNSDAWLREGALEKLIVFADEHPEAAVVGPRLLNPDGSLQRSVRGFPSVWRLATEYFFLRKLAPRSRALNAFYAGGFDHDAVREAEFVMGSAMLVRRDAADAVGLFDEDFFMFNEESDWCYRFVGAGWKVLFFPEAEVFHVGGATTKQNWQRNYREQMVSHLRFLAKHHGMREAERARKMLIASLLLRGAMFRGERGSAYRDAARWLRSGKTAALLESRG